MKLSEIERENPETVGAAFIGENALPVMIHSDLKQPKII